MTAPVLPVSDAELDALAALGKVKFPSGPELVEAFVALPRLVEEVKAKRDAVRSIGSRFVIVPISAAAPTPAEDRTPTLPETPRARRSKP